MARYGFIHDKLDIKFLILYLMARVVAPIDFPTLTDLTMCDGGVDYFEFAEAVNELVETGHLVLEDDRYAITEKGRRDGAACESSLQGRAPGIQAQRRAAAQRQGTLAGPGAGGGRLYRGAGPGRRRRESVFPVPVLRLPGPGGAPVLRFSGQARAGLQRSPFRPAG